MHPILHMLQQRKRGIPCGIPSYCTANRQVLAAILRDAAQSGRSVLIEATANQVDQFGGYTGMRPADFVRFIEQLAAETGCGMDRVLLGGDHLGPLTFRAEPEASAMDKAEALVRAYAGAGFAKIHLDTSMKVADDPAGALDKRVVAARGVRLCRAAEEAFAAYRAEHPEALHPVYVIGSEVPIPGGATEQEDSITVTRAEDCAETLAIYREAFQKAGLSAAWEHVAALVVQPGVEFGDDAVFSYDSEKAAALTAMLHSYPNLVFEGHSTDYQPAACLKQMVRDGIAILKVGPALTFALREALFALSAIEAQLLPAAQRADFPAVLEAEMLRHPENWERHYHGDADALRLARSYSLSDRARYYLGSPCVEAAVQQLMGNLANVRIPLGLLHQYFPLAAERVQTGELPCTPTALVESAVMATVNQYIAACEP